MKQSTKKTLIIMLAVAAVAVIVYIAFFRKAKAGTAEGYIDRLDVSNKIKRTIKGYIDTVKSGQDINANAQNNGINYEQALACSAAYCLIGQTIDGQAIDEATWRNWVAQIKAM